MELYEEERIAEITDAALIEKLNERLEGKTEQQQQRKVNK